MDMKDQPGCWYLTPGHRGENPQRHAVDAAASDERVSTEPLSQGRKAASFMGHMYDDVGSPSGTITRVRPMCEPRGTDPLENGHESCCPPPDPP